VGYVKPLKKVKHMKCFLLIVLVPSILMSQDFKREIDSLFETKKYDQAIEKMEVYLDNTPQELDLLELMGDAYGFKSEWSKAAVYYEKLMTIDEANANYNYKYGGVLGKLAKEGSKLKALSLIPKVKSAFLKAAKLDSNFIEVRWTIVELYTQLPGFLGGNYSKALDFADEIEQISPINGYFSKAYINDHSGKDATAKLYYSKGLDSLKELSCFENKQSEATHSKSHLNSLHYLIAKGSVVTNTQLNTSQRYIKYYIRLFSSKDREGLEAAFLLQSQILKLKSQTSE